MKDGGMDKREGEGGRGDGGGCGEKGGSMRGRG